MRSRNAWLYKLGLSGVLAFGLAGCGGGDVPDPDSDEYAAAEEGGEEAPAEPEVADAAPAPEQPVAEASADAAPAPAPASGPEATAVAASSAEAAAPSATADAKGETVKSDTAEMLALATGEAAPLSDAKPAGAADGSNAAAPNGPGSETGALQDPSMLAAPGAMADPGADSSVGIPSPGETTIPDPAAGSTGEMADGVGDAMGNDPKDRGDTNSPHGAVKAFLYALKHKDRDRLAEATALRANSDEGGKYRELFSKIIDSSIPDSELNDLASKLDGFQDTGMSNQVKSTGREGVTIRKNLKDGGWLQRTVTVRREKKGWGVLDISGPTEFNKMLIPTRSRRR